MTAPIKLMLNNAQIVQRIKDGEVGILPTDTLYGVGCKASNDKAVARLYELKGRTDKPGTIIAASIEQLVDLGIPARYLKPLEQIWPGAISIVVPTAPGMTYLDLGKYAIAVRIPDNKELTLLLEKTGPLLTTSANMPGKVTATTIQEAQTIFGNQIDFYIDGGDLSSRKPSTIIRVVDDAVDVLREGSVKIDEERGEIAR